MRPIPAAELLRQWEAGLAQPGWLWARDLLCTTASHLTPERVDALSIGERDAALLSLHEAWFGPELACRSDCPACGTPVEMVLTTAALRGDDATPPPGLDLAESTPCEVTVGEWSVQVRAPTTRDLGETAACDNVDELRAALLRRCVLRAERDGIEMPVAALPPATLAEVERMLATIDPHADIQLQLHCPACAHRWSEAFDIVSYLWSAVDGWAERLLHDVHRLAAAYGWSEPEVLALSPVRRARYLALIGSHE